jgi:transglutaminase-like putative cysteine protease
MHFEITHDITYSYSKPVFLEPMIVRLRPRANSAQRLDRFELKIEPPPTGISESIDFEGNMAATAWFNGLHDVLHISSESAVEAMHSNPFDFIITDESASMLPACYSEPHGPALEHYIKRRFPIAEVDKFVQPIVEESSWDTAPFLTKLASRIEEQFEREVRETGGPMTPDETLACGKGACRDLTLLYMEACRAVGLAARFVSGYGCGDDKGPLDELDIHAWAEVYLPGGGWRGFDPGLGLAVADQHIAVASAADPENAAPTSGTFRGTEVSSGIEYHVSIRCY